MTISKWDLRFLSLAEFISSWSKDPSTKVGAVIADRNNRIVSLGYNGLPVGIQDHDERYTDRERKLAMIVHGEMNAILFAQRSVHGCTLYTWPFAPCSNCASTIIQVGLSRVVAPQHEPLHRWSDSITLTQMMLSEAGIVLELV